MRRVSASTVLLVLLPALLALSPARAADTDATDATVATAATPVVGACHTMSLRQLYMPTFGEAPVDCAGPHTSRVLAVASVPDGVSWRNLSRLERIVSEACLPALRSALGGSAESRAMSAYDFGWFLPSRAERRAGARWLRCDVVLYGGSRLLALPASLTLPEPLHDGVTRCLTRDVAVTACSRKHAWRAVTTFTMSRPEKPATRLLVRRCARKVPGKGPVYMTNRGEVAWRLGEHTVTCYKHTRR